MDSSYDFSFDTPPNLDFYPSVDAEMKEEEEELKRNERRVSRQLNLLEISTRMLRAIKNIEFYRVFDRNRPIETIDCYNKRSTMDRFRKCRVRPIFDEGLRSLLI